MEEVVEKGLKVNPNFRAYVHAAWLVGDGLGKEINSMEDYDSSKIEDLQAALDRTRKPVEAIVDKLNEKFGKKVVFLVPVGDATVKLRAMIPEPDGFVIAAAGLLALGVVIVRKRRRRT